VSQASPQRRIRSFNRPVFLQTLCGDGTTTRRLWAWADQGLVSVGNFASTLIVARALTPGDFGVYVVLFATVLMLNTVHAALITFPLSIRGPAQRPRALAAQTATALLATALLFVVLGGIAAIAVRVTGRVTLTPYVALALICWQLQETTRTAFLAHFRQRDAVAGDVLSYWGQAVLLLVLLRTGRLSPESAFLAIGVTSAAAFVVQAVQLRLPRPGVASLFATGRDAIAYGMWGVPARISALFAVQAFPWVLFYAHGPAFAAAFQALSSAVAFTNPVMIGTANLVTATVAARSRPERFAEAWRHAYHGWALVALPLALVVWFPVPALRLLYGATTTYADYAGWLWLVVAGCMCEAVVMQATAVIGGIGRTRTLFMVQSAGLVIALAFGLPLAAYGGLGAALAGFVAVQVGRLLAALHASRAVLVGEALEFVEAQP